MAHAADAHAAGDVLPWPRRSVRRERQRSVDPVVANQIRARRGESGPRERPVAPPLASRRFRPSSFAQLSGIFRFSALSALLVDSPLSAAPPLPLEHPLRGSPLHLAPKAV